MITDYSFSTSWNCMKHHDGEDIVREIKDIGFKTIELNFQFTPEKLQSIMHCVKRGSIAISSIHNYCPVPESVPIERANPDTPSLASHQEKERSQAVAYTKKSIDTASLIKATVLVIHAGKVAIECRTRKLITLFNKNKIDSKEFQKTHAEAIDDRRHHAKEHFDALCTSFSELVPYARERNIILGIENRFYHRELPSPHELGQLFRYFKNTPLCYWHDMGHAFVLESLRFYAPQQFLESFHKKMIGMHIHDIIHLRDHHAPFQGVFNWQCLKRYAIDNVLKVIEVHSHVTPDDIIKGVQRLDSDIFKETIL